MVTRLSRFFLLGLVLVVGVLFSLNFVVADFSECWAITGATEESCLDVSGCKWDTSDSDPWCDSDIGCCTDIGCWD